MSTETRKYELRARAERQRQTRDRIAAAAAALHEEQGVERTTVAEIARRAGVTRVTVYSHFADLSELIPACSAHYMAQHPLPDLEDALAVADPHERLEVVLQRVYGWYRETEPMFGRLFAERALIPELDAHMSQGIDQLQQDLAQDLAAAFRQRGRAATALRVLIRVALDFPTWRRLSGEGMPDDAAAALMAAAVAPRLQAA